jgi:hypothetical protein
MPETLKQIVNAELKSVVVPAIGRVLVHSMEKSVLKPAQAGFERIVNQRLIPQIEKQVADLAANTVPRQVKGGLDQLASTVASQVRKPVNDCFRESFQQVSTAETSAEMAARSTLLVAVPQC